MGTFLGPGNIQEQQPVDGQGLVQLMMAVHQQKQAKTEQEKADAMARIKTLSENPDMMGMVDPAAIEKDFKTSGMPLASPEQMKAMTNLIQGGGAASAPSAPVPSNQLEQLGKTMQGSKSGAQSGAPASDSAASKAPGGGVTPGGIVTPGTGALQNLHQTALDMYTKQVGSLAPMYMGASAQKQQQFMVGQKQQELHDLFETANGGGPGALAATAQLMNAAGKNITEPDMVAVLSGSKDPQVAKDAMTFALHNESNKDKATRLDSTLKTLGSTPEFMQSLKDPTDLPRIVDSVVQGHGIPSDVLKNGLTLDQLKEERTYEDQLGKTGLDPTTAHKAARARALGVPYTMSLPTAMHGVTLQQQEGTAKTRTSEAEMLTAQADAVKASAEQTKIMSELQNPLYKNTLDEVQQIINAKKDGLKIPPEIEQGVLDAVSQLPNIGLTPQEVSHWYNWLGGTEHEYKGTSQLPTSQGQPGTGKGTVSSDAPLTHAQETHTLSKRVTGEEAQRIKNLRGSMTSGGGL
jgi:hypothetical protein